jgi:osmoprotectant transport system permease protein
VNVWSFMAAHRADVLAAVATHARMSAAALLIAIAIAVPLGIWCSKASIGSALVSAITAVRVVPSLAILTLVLPVLGLGFAPAVVALVILAFPPILINTFVGFRDVDATIREAALSTGMTPGQVVARVEAPLAFPVCVTGVRTAAVEVIASATLATFIGGGGLGDLINNGLQLDDPAMLLTGAVLVSAMALIAEAALTGLSRLGQAA